MQQVSLYSGYYTSICDLLFKTYSTRADSVLDPIEIKVRIFRFDEKQSLGQKFSIKQIIELIEKKIHFLIFSMKL